MFESIALKLIRRTEPVLFASKIKPVLPMTMEELNYNRMIRKFMKAKYYVLFIQSILKNPYKYLKDSFNLTGIGIISSFAKSIIKGNVSSAVIPLSRTSRKFPTRRYQVTITKDSIKIEKVLT